MTRRPRKRKLRADDLLRLITVADPWPSPDGKQILFTRKHVGEKNDYVTNLWMVGTAHGAPRAFSSGGKDGMGRWSPDGSRIAFLAKRDGPGPQLHLISASGGEARALTRLPEGSISSFKWSPDGQKIALAFRPGDPERSEPARKARADKGLSEPPRVLDHFLYRLDGDGYFDGRRYALHIVEVDSGKMREVFAREQGLGFDYDWAPDSSELAIVANLERDGYQRPWLDRVYRLELRSGTLRKLPRQPDGMRAVVAWSPDGRWLAVAGREGRDDTWGAGNTHLLVVDPESGRTRTLTGHQDYCLAAATLSDTREVSFAPQIRWHPDARRILAQIGDQGSSRLGAIDLASGHISLLSPAGMQAAVGGVAADGRAVGLVVDSALEPSEVAVGELSGRGREPVVAIRRLSSFNAALIAELDLVRPESAWVSSSGGARVHYWSLKPASTGARPVPAVLLVHGGPHAAYGESFMHEFQLLAASGYAVFYGNPRGSKGYGEKHSSAIRGNWGGPDWDDVQAIAGAMSKSRFVDKARLGIGGGSYGGYMTNWAISHSNIFRAAITDRCVSNLVSMAGSSDFPMIPDSYWAGAPWERPEALWAQSPIAHFGNVRCPTLVIHSEGDLRCNVEQAEQVFSALQMRGVPSRLVRYPSSTSHGMSRSGPPDLRLHRLREILSWWKKHLA